MPSYGVVILGLSVGIILLQLFVLLFSSLSIKGSLPLVTSPVVS